MKNLYLSLAIQTLVGGIIMYLVMFVMIDRISSRMSIQILEPQPRSLVELPTCGNISRQ